jgi:hypothetical protein
MLWVTDPDPGRGWGREEAFRGPRGHDAVHGGSRQSRPVRKLGQAQPAGLVESAQHLTRSRYDLDAARRLRRARRRCAPAGRVIAAAPAPNWSCAGLLAG